MRKENNNNNNILKVIDEREVLGKQFKIYGNFENPLFLAKDVAEFIDYSKNGSGVRDVSKMVSVVDNEEKLKRTMFVSGQNREVIMLTEDGLYEVLMQSRKPIAKQFKKKVKEILKDIRNKRTYTKNEILENPDLLLNKNNKKKNNNIQIFNNNEFGDLRTLLVNNIPYFIGKDVTDKLEYQNGSRDIVRHVDKDDRISIIVHDGKQNRNMIAINESGLYSLILSSKLPKAKEFKRWVTSEVLPTIRKHGVYITDEVLYSPELLEKALEQIKKERQEKLTLQFEVKSLKDTNKQLKKNTKQLTVTIQEQEPLVELSKTLLKAKNTITFGCMAKMLKTNGVNIGRNRLTKFLKEQKVLTQEVTPYQEYMNKGYFEVYQTIIGGKTVIGTRITPQGQLLIVKLIMDKYNK